MNQLIIYVVSVVLIALFIALLYLIYYKMTKSPGLHKSHFIFRIFLTGLIMLSLLTLILIDYLFGPELFNYF